MKDHRCLSSNNNDHSPLLRKGIPLLRTLLLDLPLLAAVSCCALSWMLHTTLHRYWLPQLELMTWPHPNNATYYYRTCTAKDLSANTTSQLIVSQQMSQQDAIERMLTHGASVWPSLMSTETANQVRQFIMENNNKRNDGFDAVIQPKHRKAWGLSPTLHPSIAKAVREIFDKQQFRDALEAIVGPDPAIVEFTHITSSFGAVEQHLHQDVGRVVSASATVRSMTPIYSLFVPLQNTTKEMGATTICPGSHMCGTGPNLYCRRSAFQIFEEDAWPQGWGLLYDSAMHHRGAAHTDPDALERVVFILTFASRPRFSKQQVETRLIPDHLFNAWWQWSATLTDFLNPTTHMIQPYQTLKSLGVYKPTLHNWGWDYVSFMLSLASNADHYDSISKSKLEDFLQRNTWLANLPKIIQGSFDEASSEKEKWIQYFSSAFDKIIQLSCNVYFAVLAVYFVGTVILAATVTGQSMGRTVERLLILHGSIAVFVWWYMHQVHLSTWARNIRRGVQYTIPPSRGPPLPATLPWHTDVLVPGDAFNSRYLGSYHQMLAYSHPGNIQWRQMVHEHARGFTLLSPDLQQKLASDMVHWAHQAQSRILIKNSENEWAETPNPGRWAFKELAMASSPLVTEIVKELDQLLAETVYGYWRQASMSRVQVPHLLSDLLNKIIGFPVLKEQINYGKEIDGFARIHSFLPIIPNKEFIHRLFRLPPDPAIIEPYPGAWMKVGDICEANYEQNTDEWFRGTIVSVEAETASWDVAYDGM